MVDFLKKSGKEKGGIAIPPAPRPVNAPESMSLPATTPPSPIIMPEPVDRPPMVPEMPLGKSPPLFVKIDKYKEMVKNLQSLRSLSMNMRDAIDALSDIEKELSSGISIAQKALDNINTTISRLDSKLLRVEGLVETSPGAEDVENYVKNMHDQIKKVKKDLDGLK